MGILMDDVSITHREHVSKEIREAIVARAGQFNIRSEGEAEAAKMISEALKQHGTGLIEVRRIDAAKDIADALSKSPNVMYLPPNQQMLLNLVAVSDLSNETAAGRMQTETE